MNTSNESKPSRVDAIVGALEGQGFGVYRTMGGLAVQSATGERVEGLAVTPSGVIEVNVWRVSLPATATPEQVAELTRRAADFVAYAAEVNAEGRTR